MVCETGIILWSNTFSSRDWELLSGEYLVILLRKVLICISGALKRLSQLWSISHLVSEHKSIYFLIRFAQMKATSFIFFNTWVSKGKRMFSTTRAVVHLRVGAILGGSMMLLNFLRLTRLNLDYLQYTHNLLYVTYIWRVAWKVYLTHRPMWLVKLYLIKSCTTRSFSNQDSLLLELP